MSTGTDIKAARKKAGLTQAELGARLSVTYQTIAQWENDLRKPKIESIRRIADALGVEPYSLMDFDMASVDIVKGINDGEVCKKQIIQDLDLLTGSGLKLVRDFVSAICGNPQYKQLANGEIQEVQAEIDAVE